MGTRLEGKVAVVTGAGRGIGGPGARRRKPCPGGGASARRRTRAAPPEARRRSAEGRERIWVLWERMWVLQEWIFGVLNTLNVKPPKI